VERGWVRGKNLALGNPKVMADLEIDLTSQFVEADALRKEGAIVVFLAADRVLAGLLAVSDPVKSSTAEALPQLKAAGIRVVMATRDSITTAKSVAAKLGIEDVHGEVKPKDRLDLVAKLQGEGAVVAMAGDGISDAVTKTSDAM
jgi:Cu+-exporting ATPase